VQEHRRAAQNRTRRDVDDRAATGALHAGDDRLGGLKHAARVNAKNRVPFVFADLHQRLELRRAEYTGIVDEDVDRPERRFGRRHEFL